MSNIKKILVLLLLTSCSPKVHVDSIHVHFYDHSTCEWSCLDMSDTIIPKKEWREYKKNSIK